MRDDTAHLRQVGKTAVAAMLDETTVRARRFEEAMGEQLKRELQKARRPLSHLASARSMVYTLNLHGWHLRAFRIHRPTCALSSCRRRWWRQR